MEYVVLFDWFVKALTDSRKGEDLNIHLWCMWTDKIENNQIMKRRVCHLQK